MTYAQSKVVFISRGFTLNPVDLFKEPRTLYPLSAYIGIKVVIKRLGSALNAVYLCCKRLIR
jgi:hypothetical protein